MDKLAIVGNGPLKGEVKISGAKNAALPSLTASILTKGTVTLDNLPPVQDIKTMCKVLEKLGLTVAHNAESVTIQGATIASHQAPYELVKTMRASILVLGPLLGRLGRAQVSLPGGCAIGARPVDLHLNALRQMGAEINIDHGYIDAKVSQLKGADILFETVTVTGTENIMMAACLAQGTTVLRNAAKEPEVVDLAELLISMGARIKGHGTTTIVIEGVAELHDAHHTIIPDRIETGTYVCAAAITAGHVRITHSCTRFLHCFLDKMAAAGLPIKTDDQGIEILPHRGLVACDIETQPHPGFPTDMQAQFMAVMTQAEGRSVVTESIFENRFMHVSELVRMGADIVIKGRSALISGPRPLSGAQVMATDLRASASLVLAGLIAENQTVIDRIYHLDRGYTNLEEKLRGIGAQVHRLS